MAGSSGVDLAVAAIRGGGIGSLPCALLTPDQVEQQVGQVRAAAAGPLNLNFFCHELVPQPDETAWHEVLAPYFAEYGVGPPQAPPPLRMPFDEAMCAVVERVRPEIVSFHFGLPTKALLARVRATGVAILCSATTIAEAVFLDAQGVDGVIAQGSEAGGHAGNFLPALSGNQTGLFALVQQIEQVITKPVIAAGGIADEAGIAAAFALGADAVQIGTAYLLCPEALTSPLHRAALAGEIGRGMMDTRFTNLISGRLARGIPNRLVEELGPVHPAAPPFPYASIALTELRKAAEAMGRTDFSTLWAGQSASLARAVPAEELTRILTQAAHRAQGVYP